MAVKAYENELLVGSGNRRRRLDTLPRRNPQLERTQSPTLLSSRTSSDRSSRRKLIDLTASSIPENTSPASEANLMEPWASSLMSVMQSLAFRV